jgi:hypothetical protein
MIVVANWRIHQQLANPPANWILVMLEELDLTKSSPPSLADAHPSY